VGWLEDHRTASCRRRSVRPEVGAAAERLTRIANTTGKTRYANRWLRQTPTEAARAAAGSKNTYLASHYLQIHGRRGEAKAIGATRHDILIAYYQITRDRVPFRELSPDWLAQRHSVEHRTVKGSKCRFGECGSAVASRIFGSAVASSIVVSRGRTGCR
jgi:hypothetical protein